MSAAMAVTVKNTSTVSSPTQITANLLLILISWVVVCLRGSYSYGECESTGVVTLSEKSSRGADITAIVGEVEKEKS